MPVVSWIDDARISAVSLMDRHDLYERCVQSPAELVPFLMALHGAPPRALREEFSGTAAVSRTWAEISEDHSAEAVDIDAAVLERAPPRPRVERICSDVRSADVHDASVDCVFAGNFSIGEMATRADLITYLAASLRRLRSGGLFACDTYGGTTAFEAGVLERRHVQSDGTILHHVWEQRTADALTARVVNALHFRIERDGEIVQELRDAFVYRWRLWSVPELVDALREVGFVGVTVHTTLDANDHSEPVSPSFTVLVVARAPGAH